MHRYRCIARMIATQPHLLCQSPLQHQLPELRRFRVSCCMEFNPELNCNAPFNHALCKSAAVNGVLSSILKLLSLMTLATQELCEVIRFFHLAFGKQRSSPSCMNNARTGFTNLPPSYANVLLQVRQRLNNFQNSWVWFLPCPQSRHCTPPKQMPLQNALLYLILLINATEPKAYWTYLRASPFLYFFHSLHSLHCLATTLVLFQSLV